MAATPTPPSDALPARRVAAAILAFWAGFLLLMSLRAAALGFAEAWDLLARRLLCAVGGVGLTALFWAGLTRLRARRLAVQAAAALGGAVPITLAFATLNWWLFYGLEPPPSLQADIARWGFARVFRYAVVDTSVSWLFFFAGGALFLLVLQWAMAAAAQARRAADAERTAHVAELRALRHQINPHFLFNSLNALSCLVLEGRTRDADRMILELSALLRRIMAETGEGDVPLAEEFELQQLYLAIEARRFGPRLSRRFDLPDALRDARVPPLLLQPLVENAVKHAVARSSGPVELAVRGWREGASLLLEVSDSGAGGDGAEAPAAASHGIGLKNVRERLAARHGAAARLTAGPGPAGGYVARISLPYEAALGEVALG